MNLLDLARKRDPRCRAGRVSSYDKTGANADWWLLQPGETKVLAEIEGPAVITHIWMTQLGHQRECVLKITWDDADAPSVLCPLGDFFGLGHNIGNSYESQLFSASTNDNNKFDVGVALNCYAPMPFRKRAKIELVNEGDQPHIQYFYFDYETVPDASALDELDYFHAEFRRAYPFTAWSPNNNLGRDAWENNYVILETKGAGRYIGCNLSVTNFQKGWWGEGDDMIWVDGYKWPPDLHGTGSEDYFNQAWCMQPNAFQRCGSSIWENHTGGYQTCYVHHLENPVHFTKEIKVTIEHNHANQASNEFSSVAYWYAAEPTAAVNIPPVEKRMPVRKVNGKWDLDEDGFWLGNGTPGLWTESMARSLKFYYIKHTAKFFPVWEVSKILPDQTLENATAVSLDDTSLEWHTVDETREDMPVRYVVGVPVRKVQLSGLVYMANKVTVNEAGKWEIYVGHDAGLKLFIDGQLVTTSPAQEHPAAPFRTQVTVDLSAGEHEIVAALEFDKAILENAGMFFSFFPADHDPKDVTGVVFPERVG